jgi:hypothetical protein
MSAPVWSQLDAGVASALGAILVVAAVRKLQNPRVFALTLERLDPALNGRRALALRWACFIAGYEAVAGIGVVAFRGGLGFPFACAVLIACTAFLVALGRAVQQSLPCACFGRLGRTAAGGREIARAVVLVLGASFLVVHRAIESGRGYGLGPFAVVALVVTVVAIVGAQRIGAKVRPGVEPAPIPTEPRAASGRSPAGRSSLGRSVRTITGYDSDLYSTSA